VAFRMAVHVMIAEDRIEGEPRAGSRSVSTAGLAGVLHDLCQPLAGIRALASAPSSQRGSAEAADELSERLRRIAELGEWMNDLLRSESTALTHVDAVTGADATEVVQSVLVAAAASFTGTLHWRPSGPASVPLDAVELRRAFGNVIDNATRAAGPNGSVHVRVRVGRSSVCIEVEDSGPGFGRVRPQTQRGLAVTQAMLARCGGALEIGSGRSGGTHVRMRLPRAVVGLSA